MATLDYIDVAYLKPYAFQHNADDDSLFAVLISNTSRIIDQLCSVQPGYFKQKSTVAEPKVIYGNGASFLTLPRFFGDPPTISMPDLYTAPSFVIEGGNNLRIVSNGLIQNSGNRANYIWPVGVPVTVTAKWGFEDVPADIKEATAELTIAVWRSKDTSFLKAVQLDNTNQIVNEAVPKRVQLICSAYRNFNSVFFV